MESVRLALGGAIVATSAAVAYRLVVTGSATVDVGVGRRTRPLGPIEIAVAAPREVLFDVISAPYLGRTPQALAGEISVLEAGADMVVAAHRTMVRGLVTTTVESVRFVRPETVDFRLLRGPVPHVTERFSLEEAPPHTRLLYTGELGTDFWQVGMAWGAVVARKWEATVKESLQRVKAEAERRSGTRSAS